VITRYFVARHTAMQVTTPRICWRMFRLCGRCDGHCWPRQHPSHAVPIPKRKAKQCRSAPESPNFLLGKLTRPRAWISPSDPRRHPGAASPRRRTRPVWQLYPRKLAGVGPRRFGHGGRPGPTAGCSSTGDAAAAFDPSKHQQGLYPSRWRWGVWAISFWTRVRAQEPSGKL